MKDGIAIEKFDLLFDKKSTILELGVGLTWTMMK